MALSPDYRTLISVGALAANLRAEHWVVLDCRFTLSDPAAGRASFTKARLPGARYVDLERDLSGPRGERSGRNPLPDPAAFAQRLADWGVTPASQVVVYDDSFGSIAARLWWMLRWVGHRRVALLDGGWPLWKRLQGPVDEAPRPRHTKVATAPYPVAPDAALVADRALVERIREAPDWRLIDARPEDRFTGEREAVDPIGGHIPGSSNRTFEDNLAFDGTWLDAAELAGNFQRLLADTRGKNVVHTCGSGVTACHNVLAMEHAGLPGSRLYVGSWSEWITQADCPLARGLS